MTLAILSSKAEAPPQPARVVPHFPRWLVLVISGVVIIADQASKRIVAGKISEHAFVEVIPGFLNLTHTTNTGIAFGLLSGSSSAVRVALLGVVGLSLLAFVLYMVWQPKHLDRAAGLGLALILGGALSNMADRIRAGAVVDFIDAYFRTYHWYTFNLADSAIVVGAFFLVVHLFKSE